MAGRVIEYYDRFRYSYPIRQYRHFFDAMLSLAIGGTAVYTIEKLHETKISNRGNR
jgi:hypothetical protein